MRPENFPPGDPLEEGYYPAPGSETQGTRETLFGRDRCAERLTMTVHEMGHVKHQKLGS